MGIRRSRFSTATLRGIRLCRRLLVFRTFMNWTRGHSIFPGYSQTYPEVTFNGVSPAGPISLSSFGSGLQASFRGADGSLRVTVP